MTALQGTVRVQPCGRTITFEVAGRATMSQSLPVRRYAEQALAEGVTSIRVDLRHCTYLDSTFLGTLLFLKRAMERRGEGEFALVSPSPPCACLLQQMGLSRVFSLAMAEEPAGPWTELRPEVEDVGAFKQAVVQAHQELAGLTGPAGEPFRKVACVLTRELEAEKAR